MTANGAAGGAHDPAAPGADPIVLREFDWSGIAKGSLFTGQLAGIVGLIVGLSALSGKDLPVWLIVDPALSVTCVFLAFVRVWKSGREEQETSEVWERASHAERHQGVLDRVVEIPYVFLVLALPLTVTLPQAFMLTLMLFYVFDNYYNAALARISDRRMKPDAQTEPTYVRQLVTALRRSLVLLPADLRGGANPRLTAYFRTRSRYDSAFIASLFVALVAATLLKAGGWPDLAWWTVFATLVLIVVVEWLIEPLRNLDMRFDSEPPAAGGSD